METTVDEATELRNYLYDLQGYIVVKDVLSAEQVATLNALLDEHLPAIPDDWRERHGPRGPTTPIVSAWPAAPTRATPVS